eukprot:2011797-Amphidinium_carterae.1
MGRSPLFFLHKLYKPRATKKQSGFTKRTTNIVTTESDKETREDTKSTKETHNIKDMLKARGL